MLNDRNLKSYMVAYKDKVTNPKKAVLSKSTLKFEGCKISL